MVFLRGIFEAYDDLECGGLELPGRLLLNVWRALSLEANFYVRKQVVTWSPVWVLLCEFSLFVKMHCRLYVTVCFNKGFNVGISDSQVLRGEAKLQTSSLQTAAQHLLLPQLPGL